MRKKNRVLCFGDSNTYGYDPRVPLGGRYPREIRWTGRLAGWDVCNGGQNGREIPTRPAEFNALGALLMTPPEILTVMLGSNDLLFHARFTAEDVTARMERLLDYIRERAPETGVLLIAPVQMRPGSWVREERLLRESPRLSPCYAALASQLGIAFADAASWEIALSFDGVHFLPEGHAAFAQRLDKVLRQNFDT